MILETVINVQEHHYLSFNPMTWIYTYMELFIRGENLSLDKAKWEQQTRHNIILTQSNMWL